MQDDIKQRYTMTCVESKEGQATSHENKDEMTDNYGARKYYLPVYMVPL